MAKLEREREVSGAVDGRRRRRRRFPGGITPRGSGNALRAMIHLPLLRSLWPRHRANTQEAHQRISLLTVVNRNNIRAPQLLSDHWFEVDLGGKFITASVRPDKTGARCRTGWDGADDGLEWYRSV